eukprot:3662955-Rhodomonas_salina.1
METCIPPSPMLCVSRAPHTVCHVLITVGVQSVSVFICVSVSVSLCICVSASLCLVSLEFEIRAWISKRTFVSHCLTPFSLLLKILWYRDAPRQYQGQRSGNASRYAAAPIALRNRTQNPQSLYWMAFSAADCRLSSTGSGSRASALRMSQGLGGVGCR